MSHLRGLFVSSTGTSEGKTVVTSALTSALRKSGSKVAAVKPIETGCTPHPEDALTLARVSGEESLAWHPAWYRATLPASPYAVELEISQPAPDIAELTAAIQSLAADYEGVIVEGAGGLFVPLSRRALIADFAHTLGLPIVLVANDRLGVLSHVLATAEAAAQRQLRIAAVVLNSHGAVDATDEAVRTNRSILAERMDCPVLELPSLPDLGDVALNAAAISSGLLRLALAELDNI